MGVGKAGTSRAPSGGAPPRHLKPDFYKARGFPGVVMARSIYEKSTRELLKDMVAELKLQPGQILTSTRILEWFATHYPKLNPSTISAHLVRMSTNERNRLHHTVTPSDDLFFKVAKRQFRLYEPGKDPAPIHEFEEGDVEREEKRNELETEEGTDEADPGSSEFLLERDLQRYLAENLECIEPGLKLYEADDLVGFEFEAGGGRRIDILAVDRLGGLVVIELKVSKGYDRVVGQLLRYVNWVRQNLAERGQNVRGVIVCRTISEDLRLASAGLPNLELFEYQLSVKVSRVPALEIPH